MVLGAEDRRDGHAPRRELPHRWRNVATDASRREPSVAADRRARREVGAATIVQPHRALARQSAAPTQPVTDAGQAFELKIDVNSHPTVNVSGRVVFTPQKSAATVG